MLTPCPHCDQQVIPDGDGACPLCGGVVLDLGDHPDSAPGEAPDTQGAASDAAECGQAQDTVAQDVVAQDTVAQDATVEGCSAEPAPGTCQDTEKACPPPASADRDDVPVWAQAGDDLVAPPGLLPDEDDEEEDDVVEADAEEPAPPPRQAGASQAACAAAVSSPPVEPSGAPSMLIPGVLLGAVLAVQIAIAIWVKQQEHVAELAPMFGFAAMLVLAIGALFALGRGATDKAGLRPFTSFQFLMVLFA